MIKKNVLLIIFLVVLSFQVSAQQQTSYTPFSDKICNRNSCEIKIYSYERYFQRNGNWEEVDENWYNCGDNFCTRSYYFNVEANRNGQVISERNSEQLTMQLSNLLNRQLTFNPTIQDSVLTYENILPNIDLQYQYLPRKLKEEIIIKEPLRNLPNRDFEISFIKSGNANFAFLPSTICDSNNTCEFLDTEINQNEINITIPIDFLNSERTQYPVIIDPTLILNDSYVSWNGYIENRTNSSGNFYTRTSNPVSDLILYQFLDEEGVTKSHTAGIEFNTVGIPDATEIYNLTLQVYLTATDFLMGEIEATIKVMEMEKNSSSYTDENSLCGGNCNFFSDMGNGTLYNKSTHTTGLINFTLSSDASTDLTNTLSEDVFALGLYTTSGGGDIKISSKDNVDKTKRPVLIINSSYEVYDLEYDANGNLIEGFGKTFVYDSWNRMTEIKNSETGKGIAYFIYDHEGNRVYKETYDVDDEENNLSTYYIRGQGVEFVHNRLTNGTIFNETYLYLQDKLVAKIDNDNRKFFYHPDHLGSTTLVTNETGDVVEDISYLPFGDLLREMTDAEQQRFLYTGQEYDRESELLYYGARYYKPEFRRFLAPDPMIQDVYNPQNLNSYSYVLNNPYKYVDPDGEFAVTAAGVLLGIYIVAEATIDVISLRQSINDLSQDSGSGINRLAFALDVIDTASPFSFPGPSGITVKGLSNLFEKEVAKDVIMGEILAGSKKFEDNIRNIDQKNNGEIEKNKENDEFDGKLRRTSDEEIKIQQNQQTLLQPINEEGKGSSPFSDSQGNNPGRSSGFGRGLSSRGGGSGSGGFNSGRGGCGVIMTCL